MKKILSTILTFVLVFCCFTMIPKSEAYTAHTVDEAISYLNTLVGQQVGSGQCVALIKHYYEYLGAPTPYGNGCDYATNPLPSGWSRIQGVSPQKGDIMVWTGGLSGYGHVAICGGDGVYFHQNWHGFYVEIASSSWTNGFTITSTGERAYYWGVIRPDYSTLSIAYKNITPDNYFIKNKATGNYLTVSDSQDADKAPIHTYKYGNLDCQVFNIYKVSDGYEMMPLNSTSRVVNPYCNTVVSGKEVTLYHKTNESSQWWKFEAVGDGYDYIIRNVQNPSVCLTGYDSGAIVSTYTGADNQIWNLEEASIITYDPNGGSGAPASQRTRAGYKTVLSAQKPIKTCHKFMGWSTAKNDTIAAWDEKTAVTIYGDTTVYAVWKQNHEYVHIADPSCNVCGATRTVTYTGWVGSGSKQAYYINGKLQKNRWINYKGTWYYVGADGYRKTDCWQQGSKGLCYLTKQGYMATNCWVNYKGTWYYVDAYGYRVTDKWMDGAKGKCYLTKKGYMAVNQWVNYKGTWYYVNNEGYRVTNKWVKGAKGWCWLTKNGYMATNSWVKDTKGWCYVNNEGYAVYNCWKKGAKGWCWLGKDNYMVTNSWVKDTKGWCFVDKEGYAVSNCWKKGAKGWCWLGKDNYMVTNSWVKDTKSWAFVDQNGYAVSNCWKRNANGWFYIGSNNYIVTNTTLKIDGFTYKFNKNGVCTNM